MDQFTGFPRDTIDFLADLADNNDRTWFEENRQRYETAFLKPALAFIRAIDKPLRTAAPLLRAVPKKSGGSLMRIYRDVRFSKNKSPYKTNIGIHFRHEMGRDVHAPGVYLHIAPEECFLGAGIWMPPSEPLRRIRTAIAEQPQQWKKAVSQKRFREHFTLYDDRLKSAPRGFDKQHPNIDDLRLKSFLGTRILSRNEVESPQLVQDVIDSTRRARWLMRFLCDALEVPY